MQDLATSKYQNFQDTDIKVDGPYRAVKLPISKGVKIGNPIQIALGPKGLLYAMNQTGEVYTLHDSDGDGTEDNVKKSEIEKMENESKSLMYENLLSGMTEEKRKALLDYLTSLSKD